MGVKGILDSELGILGEIRTDCELCGADDLLLDVSRHGYDAEYGHGSSYAQPVGSVSGFRCLECGFDKFQVFPWFTYQFESLNEFEGIDSKRIPDFFDTFGIDLRCQQCSGISYIGSYECA